MNPLNVAGILVLAPLQFASLVDMHVQKIVADCPAVEISNDDLFHGHFYTRETFGSLTTLEEITSSVSMMLYHTAEYNHRWQNEQVPVAYKTHRSLFGLTDGDVFPAIYAITPGDYKTYESHGTVFHFDVPQDTFRSADTPQIFGKEEPCRISYQFEIRQTPEGRYFVHGKPYDVYFPCS